MAVLSADRPRLHQIVPRLAEELGEDAGRLQLLLLDLREALLVSANRECVYVFPQASQFWNQFSESEGRSFAAALSTLGRRYDGARRLGGRSTAVRARDGHGHVAGRPRSALGQVRTNGRRP